MQKKHTQNPVLGGASVVGLVFEDGVIIASDNLQSYGSMARFYGVQRVHKVNKNTILGANGDLADFQHIWKLIEQKQIEVESKMEGKNIGPLALHTWLTRLNYNKRCKFDPYWVEWVIGGIQDGKPFLGYVDKRGTCFTEKAICSGVFGQMAYPLLREYEDSPIKLTEEKAREIVTKVLEIYFSRACYSTYTYNIAIVKLDKEAKVEGPFELNLN